MRRAIGLLTATVLGGIAIGVAAPSIATPMPSAPYKNCAEARQNGDCKIPSTSDKYQSKLDADGDGIGCEWCG